MIEQNRIDYNVACMDCLQVNRMETGFFPIHRSENAGKQSAISDDTNDRASDRKLTAFTIRRSIEWSGERDDSDVVEDGKFTGFSVQLSVRD